MAAAHSSEMRAQVIAALMQGQGVRDVARQFGISCGTVSGWRKDAGLNGDTPIKSEKRAEIDELLVTYLTQSLTTLRVQAEQLRDKKWLAKQPAESVAVLHGVMFDKVIRLLEAFRPAGEADGTAPPPADPGPLPPVAP